jgi:hypothetical protein
MNAYLPCDEFLRSEYYLIWDHFCEQNIDSKYNDKKLVYRTFHRLVINKSNK